MFMSGTRLWPPARSFASSPWGASRDTASGTVRGARYASGAGFIEAGRSSRDRRRQTTGEIAVQHEGQQARGNDGEDHAGGEQRVTDGGVGGDGGEQHRHRLRGDRLREQQREEELVVSRHERKSGRGGGSGDRARERY